MKQTVTFFQIKPVLCSWIWTCSNFTIAKKVSLYLIQIRYTCITSNAPFFHVLVPSRLFLTYSSCYVLGVLLKVSFLLPQWDLITIFWYCKISMELLKHHFIDAPVLFCIQPFSDTQCWVFVLPLNIFCLLCFAD